LLSGQGQHLRESIDDHDGTLSDWSGNSNAKNGARRTSLRSHDREGSARELHTLVDFGIGDA
jgi:hypothetical protein